MKVGAAERIAQATATGVGPPPFPTSVRNVQRIKTMPWVLVALLASIALIVFASALHASLRASRRDVATLSTLGAEHRWTARVTRWQATWLTMIPLLVGLPIGALVGGFVFRVFATQIGAVADPALPLRLIALLAGGLLVAAMLVTVGPIMARRRRSISDLLHTL